MIDPTTTTASTAASSTFALDDSSSWHREGPVRLLQREKWTRKNGPVACELCRRRRVRCSGFETGAPCQSCIRRNECCVVGDDTYTPDQTPTTIFIPILPPPPAPCTSPSSSSIVPLVLDNDALRNALESRIPRPAPLVWKSTDDSVQPNGSTARGLRQKRSTTSYVEDEPEPPAVVAPRAAPKKRARALVADDTPPSLVEHVEHVEQHELMVEASTSSSHKRSRRPSPSGAKQIKLCRHVPERASPTPQPGVQLAVFSSRTGALVRIKARKVEPHVGLGIEQAERAPFSTRFPTSCARDEPKPDRRSLLARTSSASPTSHRVLAASIRRDSLASSSSLNSSDTTLCGCAAPGERRASTATSASSFDEVGGEGKGEGEATVRCVGSA